jgi:hypothetical protein
MRVKNTLQLRLVPSDSTLKSSTWQDNNRSYIEEISFTVPNGPLPYTQEPTTGSSLSQINPIYSQIYYFFEIIIFLILL